MSVATSWCSSPLWYKRLKWWAQDKLRNVKCRTEALVWRWQGNGYECIDCGGTDTRFKAGHYKGVVNGKPMLLEYSNYNLPFGKTLCPHCLCSRITQYWSSAATLLPDDTGYVFNTSDGIYNGTCTWYGPDLMVTEGIRQSDNPAAMHHFPGAIVMIGGNWWNGHPASLSAITELLTTSGSLQTSFVVGSKFQTDDAGSLYLTNGQYSDGRIRGDAQAVTDVVKGRRGSHRNLM